MRLVIFVITMILFMAGCEQKTKIIYLDENGSEVKTEKQFGKLQAKIECDDRGYAYYTEINGYRAIAPILVNGGYGAFQVKCESLLNN